MKFMITKEIPDRSYNRITHLAWLILFLNAIFNIIMLCHIFNGFRTIELTINELNSETEYSFETIFTLPLKLNYFNLQTTKTVFRK